MRWSRDAPKTGIGGRKFTAHSLFNNLAFGPAKVKFPAVLAEGHLTRPFFGSMLRMIAALPLPDG